jgi:uncharacterized protein (TIGR03089 family)
VQLTPPSRPDPEVTDLAAALRAATERVGAGPAITVLFPEGRQEQGMASLAQWAAKGAHLLELDAMLGPGDTIGLDAPLSWTSAAVCLAAWWAGVAVALDGDVEVAVVHEDRHGAARGDDVYVLGDGIDGGPTGDPGDEPWVRAVQTFPDHPPPPRASADAVALRSGSRAWTQRDLLERARTLAPGSGTVGVDAEETDPVVGLIAVAVRPLATLRPTVVLRGVEHAAADGDRVAAWIEC